MVGHGHYSKRCRKKKQSLHDAKKNVTLVKESNDVKTLLNLDRGAAMAGIAVLELGISTSFWDRKRRDL
jgi:hypothetical protein